jgi:hypothetical protein
MNTAESGLAELYHVYDTAARVWADVAATGLAGWLEPNLAGTSPPVIDRKNARLAVPVVEADLILQVGPKRLMQIEFETSPGSDLAKRMLDYRARIMNEYPEYELTQYVIVLGSGVVPRFDDMEQLGFALAVKVVYLRDYPPQDFLISAALAPFAVLARGSRSEREWALGAAIQLIRTSEHPHRNVLLQVADAFAGIRLDRLTVERIEKENGMSIEPMVKHYLTTEVGQRMVTIGREEGLERGMQRGVRLGQELGREQGLEQGLEQGREQGLEQGLGQGREQGLEQGLGQGRERLLLALLRVRFGDGPDVKTVAQRLAGWDEEAAAAAITSADTAAVLLDAQPPIEAGS